MRAIAVISLMFLFSCKKNIDQTTTHGETPDLTTKVNASVSGFVTDENNAAVDGATVKFGSMTTTTNQFGFFEIKNADVVKKAAVVSISKTGYFKGFKTYEAGEGKSNFLRARLIPKTNSGTFDAGSGGTVSLTNGLSVSLPANAVVDASTNASYNGIVNVASHWVDPTSAENAETRIGDYRGIDSDGSLKLMNSFGMAAIELTGTSGQLLQIAAGKKATLSLPIPASLLPNAPSTISLSYFDETTGLWKQDGTATKTGNAFSGEVSHFSFWDGVTWMPLVHFDMTVLDANNNPLQNALVNISYLGYAGASAWTDANGYVEGAIPDNQQLIVNVMADPSGCVNPVFTQTINTSGTDISLGNVNVTISLANVSGTLTDCDNLPVSNGCVYMKKLYTYDRYNAAADGSFNFSAIICPNSTGPATFVGQDISNLQLSLPLNYSLVQGNNAIGNLNACANTAPEYFVYSVNGVSTTLSSPGAAFSDLYVPNAPGRYAIGYETNNTVWITYNDQNIAPNSVLPLISFFPVQMGDSMLVTTPVQLFITEFGNIDEHISGNFSGVLTGVHPPNNTYNVSCNFRIKRSF